MRYLIFNNSLSALKNRLEPAEIKSNYVSTSPEIALNVGLDFGKGKASYVLNMFKMSWQQSLILSLRKVGKRKSNPVSRL